MTYSKYLPWFSSSSFSLLVYQPPWPYTPVCSPPLAFVDFHAYGALKQLAF